MKFSKIPMDEFKANPNAVSVSVFGPPPGLEENIGDLETMISLNGPVTEIMIRVSLDDTDLELLQVGRAFYFVILGDTLPPVRVAHIFKGGDN